MRWEKLGMLWAPSGELPWARSHAQLPVARAVAQDEWCIYVACRDAAGKSRIGSLRVEVRDHPVAVAFNPEPVLDLGEPGTFDDSGVMPSWVIDEGDSLRLYYLGWNVVGTVPYRLSIGMAVSDDGGRSFRRCSQGPLVDRGVNEPFFATAPCVLRDGDTWRLWYVSCTGWLEAVGRWEPKYHVKQATSSDGIAWSVTGQSAFEPRPDEAIGRPCVFRTATGYGMLYSSRSLVDYRTERSCAYRLGYAESPDGVHWTRRDELVGIDVSDDGWDSQMIEYCWVQQHAGETYLLYNGNGFGAAGFGVARLVA